MALDNISCSKSFTGWQKQYRHGSQALNCTMQFSIFLPPEAENQPVPVLYWLSGLTCTELNFMQKAGAQRMAAEMGIAIVAADTSPRGNEVPDIEGDDELGLGAGFYVNAIKAPWQHHYKMYDYIVHELPNLIEENFPVTGQRAISGHSMGGHGALVIGLSHPHRYSSISAFCPIACPSQVPWGINAFSAYLGENREHWQQYDASELLKLAITNVPILIDQGDADPFLTSQLQPDILMDIARTKGYPLDLRLQAGYDHSYYFVASFIEQHLKFHSLYF